MSTSKKSIKELKSLAKGQLIGKYPIAILAGLLAGLIQLVVTYLADSVSSATVRGYILKLIVVTIIDLLSGILVYGVSRFYLNIVRGVTPLSVSDVFYGFKNNMDKAVMVQSIFTLVSIIATIPAVLISLEIWQIPYSSYNLASLVISVAELILILITNLFLGFSFYVLTDHPEYSVGQIFSESSRLLKGVRLKYLLIYLSIIPLMFVGFLAFVVGLLWVKALMGTIIANFYLDCIGEEPANAIAHEENEQAE